MVDHAEVLVEDRDRGACCGPGSMVSSPACFGAICININDEEVEISKSLDKYSIINIISEYNKDLASEINKMDFYKIEHPKTKKSYENLIMPFKKALDNKTNIVMINLKRIISLIKI